MSLFFNDTATTEIYTLSLHDALPILLAEVVPYAYAMAQRIPREFSRNDEPANTFHLPPRSEEHTSELQSRQYLVCRLLLEKKYSHQTLPSIPSLLAPTPLYPLPPSPP